MSAKRHGTVFIAEDIHARRSPWFFGYWEAEPDRPPALLEDMPDTADLDEAISWGRARAEVVLVRVVARDYFSAGDREPRASLPRWPPPWAVIEEIAEERRRLRRDRDLPAPL